MSGFPGPSGIEGPGPSGIDGSPTLLSYVVSGFSRTLLETIDSRNVRMIQGCEDFRLTLKPREPLGVAGERLRQDIERNLALKARVARTVDLPHAAGAERTRDLIDDDTGARRKSHGWRQL